MVLKPPAVKWIYFFLSKNHILDESHLITVCFYLTFSFMLKGEN